MEFFDLKYGVAGICLLLTIFVLVRVGEFLWSLREKKDSASEESIKNLTAAVQANTAAIEKINLLLSDLPKMRLDLRRSFGALKNLAGDKWPQIREGMKEDEQLL